MIEFPPSTNKLSHPFAVCSSLCQSGKPSWQSTGITERLDNYPGFPEGVTGADFAKRVIEQSKRYGVELLSAQNVIAVGNDDDAHFVETDSGHRYRSNAVLIATGSTYKRLGVSGERDYIGAGVHFFPTCDGPFYQGRRVAFNGRS